jgi:putative addiction module component (TIGR02574 family)
MAEDNQESKEESLTDSQRQELDRRKAEHERDPDAAKPWSEIKARLEGRHR